MTSLKTIIKSKLYPTIHPTSELKNQHIVVLIGGMSTEREVSLMSSQAIVDTLKDLGYTVTPVDMGQDIAEVLIKLNPSIVYNGLYGTYGEDGCIAGLLNILKIPYTHSGVLASAVGFDKLKSKLFFLSNNITCPNYIVLNKEDNIKHDPMPRPYVIKPISQGSSVGIIIVNPEDNFSIKDYDFPYGDTVLIEEFIPGKELSVAVLSNKALGAIELRPKIDFYNYEAKYIDGVTEHIMPAEVSPDIYQQLLDTACKAHQLLGCTGVSRSDFRYNPTTNQTYLLEINTQPGMTPLSLVPEIAKYSKITFKDIIKTLINDAKYGT